MTAFRVFVCALALLLLAGGCTLKYVKFPAEEYLIDYMALRLAVQDETYTARRRCDKARETLQPAIQVKCERLDVKMAGWDARDKVLITAVLTGGTVDKETYVTIFAYASELLRLAAEIAL
jgi:hypothetical protein